MQPYVFQYSGKTIVVRALNRLRRVWPRATHFIDALTRVHLGERRTGFRALPEWGDVGGIHDAEGSAV